jgi:hypothetical protein
MTTVVWSVFSDENTPWIPLAFFDPTPAYPEIVASRNFVTGHANNFLGCPAITGYFKNTFVIKSPVDIHLIFDSDKNWISIKNCDQKFYDSFIENRCDVRTDSSTPMIMSLKLYYYFYSENSCLVESLDPTMHCQPCIENIRVIPGTFDISKWFRFLQPSFEIIDPSKPLIIKRGDPLFYVRLIPKDDSKVNLVYKEFNKEMLNETIKCMSLKFGLRNLSLKTLYELGKRVNKNVFKLGGNLK